MKNSRDVEIIEGKKIGGGDPIEYRSSSGSETLIEFQRR